MSLTNQKCLAQPALINLHPNKYGQELRYYPFAVNLDRCVTSYNTFHKLSNKVCAPNETEKINLYVINMRTSINESKILAKHHAGVNVSLIIENVTSIKSEITRSAGMSVEILKNIIRAKKIIFGILIHLIMKMVNI